MGRGLPGGMVAGGGGAGLVIFLIVIVVTQLGGGSSGGSLGSGLGLDTRQVAGTDLTQCETGEDATRSQDCRIVATVNSIQGFWEDELPAQTGIGYKESVTTLFSGSVNTACGGATSQVGPFYCPADDGVYVDVAFFDAMLEGQLGATGGDFAESYVLAHEYGHHIQDLLGTMDEVRTRQGETSDAVRLELQADCYAGVWTRAATTVEDDSGQVLILELTEADIAEAINAAEAVGDDRIQEQTQGQVNPETWTHGSAADRKQWFLTGMREGTVAACDTFRASSL